MGTLTHIFPSTFSRASFLENTASAAYRNMILKTSPMGYYLSPVGRLSPDADPGGPVDEGPFSTEPR